MKKLFGKKCFDFSKKGYGGWYVWYEVLLFVEGKCRQLCIGLYDIECECWVELGKVFGIVVNLKVYDEWKIMFGEYFECWYMW